VGPGPNALATSRLANPNTNTSRLLAARFRGFVPPVFHLPTLLWPPLPPAVGISLLAISRSSRPNSRAFCCEVPIRDPTCGSNGYSPSRFLRPRDLSTQYLGLHPANSRVREITDLCHLSSSDGRPLSSRYFASRDLAQPKDMVRPPNSRTPSSRNEPTHQLIAINDPRYFASSPRRLLTVLFENFCAILGVTRLTAITHRPLICFAK
jgi:hypothetical protein